MTDEKPFDQAAFWKDLYDQQWTSLKYWMDKSINYEAAIRKHWHTKEHERCWENDEDLYRMLPEYEAVCGKFGPQDRRLPKEDVFLHKCKEYYKQQTTKALPKSLPVSLPVVKTDAP